MKRQILSLLSVLFLCPIYSQNLGFDCGGKQGSANSDNAEVIELDDNGNIFIAGRHDQRGFVSRRGVDCSYDWGAFFFSTTGTSTTTGLAVDNDSSVYAVGNFFGTVDFDPSFGDETFLTSEGSSDMFIIKLSSEGELVWVYQIGDDEIDHVFDIEIASNGDLIIVGDYKGTVDFDPTTSISNLGSAEEEGFILRLNSTGDFVWVKRLVAVGSRSSVYDVELDENDNIYISGVFNGTTDFDTSSNDFDLSTLGDRDIFISKRNQDGDLIWATSFGSSGADYPRDLDLDSNNDVLIVGTFPNDLAFPNSSGPTVLISGGLEDALICKHNSDGDFLWANSLSHNGNQWAWGLAIDDQDNAYMGGEFIGTMDFDPGPQEFLLSTISSADPYISQYDSNGIFQYAYTFGGFGTNRIRDMKMKNGVFATIGNFEMMLDPDPTSGSSNINTNGQTDVFFNRLNICPSSSSNLNITSCGSYIAPSGAEYSSSGIYSDIIENSVGCDSVISIDLVILEEPVNSIALAGCDSIMVNNTWYYNDQIVEFTIPAGASNGCDSIVSNTLSISSSQNTQENISICQGESILIHGSSVSEEGIYSSVFTGTNGCDSTSTISLDVIETVINSAVLSDCDSLMFNGQWYLESELINEVIVNGAANGCDSIVDIEILIGSAQNFISETICPYDSILFDGVYINEAGIYNDTLLSTQGCDSIVTLEVMAYDTIFIDPVLDQQTEILSIEDLYSDYQWYYGQDASEPIDGATNASLQLEFTQAAAGYYWVSFVDQNGCTQFSSMFFYVTQSLEELSSISAIYPIPFEDVLTIEFRQELGNIEIEIYNALGALVLNQSYASSRIIQLELDQSPGVYFIKLMMDDNIYYSKVIKE